MSVVVGTAGGETPQWNSAMKTGSTRDERCPRRGFAAASMEPGHEDRKHLVSLTNASFSLQWPQWNPAVKTGSTSMWVSWMVQAAKGASMEPGREDREHAKATR